MKKVHVVHKVLQVTKELQDRQVLLAIEVHKVHKVIKVHKD